MNQQTTYTPYHPRWHRTRVSTYWWLWRRSYFLFILRELSSLSVAWVVIYVLALGTIVIGVIGLAGTLRARADVKAGP